MVFKCSYALCAPIGNVQAEHWNLALVISQHCARKLTIAAPMLYWPRREAFFSRVVKDRRRPRTAPNWDVIEDLSGPYRPTTNKQVLMSSV